jgi:vitamin B12 transporter
MKRGLRLAALCGAAGLGATAPLHGQEPRDTVRLEEVVVTATRLPTPLAATTAAVTVVTGQELRAHGVATVADALRLVPGADVVETGPRGGATSLFLRGGESGYVRVLLDGVPLNPPGAAYDFANLTTDDVERIEIVRGPASVLYGSDAVSGVVQVFTRRGLGPARWEAGVRGGTFGSRGLDVGVDGGGAGGAGSLSWSHYTTDGIYAFNNRYRHDVVSGAASLAPDGRTTARVTARYTDDVYHYPTDPSGNVVHHNQYQAGRMGVASFDAGRFFTPRVEGRVLLGLTEGRGIVDQEPDGPGDTLGYYGFQSYDRLNRRSADARLNVYAGGATVVTAGAVVETEAERSRNASQSQYGPSSGALVVSRWNRAAYAQAVSDLGGRLALDGGVRLEDNHAFGTFVTWRLGAAYRRGGTKLRAAVGTAFREPSFFENYATGYVTGNPALKPERSSSWDAGVEQVLLAGRLALSATWFAQRFRDLIQYTSAAPVSGGPNYYNVAAANASGLELEARSRPASAVAVTLRYTYLRTRAADSGFDGASYALGRRLLRRPTHEASLDVAYGRPGGAGGSATAQYVGDRDDEDFSVFPGRRVVLPAYVRVDVAGELPLVGGGGVAGGGGARPRVTATLRVENLFDARYEQVLHFPARRRAVVVGLRLTGAM